MTEPLQAGTRKRCTVISSGEVACSRKIAASATSEVTDLLVFRHPGRQQPLIWLCLGTLINTTVHSVPITCQGRYYCRATAPAVDIIIGHESVQGGAGGCSTCLIVARMAAFGRVCVKTYLSRLGDLNWNGNSVAMRIPSQLTNQAPTDFT